jgi:hypothetical protein
MKDKDLHTFLHLQSVTDGSLSGIEDCRFKQLMSDVGGPCAVVDRAGIPVPVLSAGALQ